MKSLFYKIFFFMLFIFNQMLFADGTTIPISVSNPSVNENAGTVTFTITLDKAPISIFGMVVKYKTRDGSAIAIDDYEEKTGGFFDFKWFSKGTTSRDVTLDIYDDAFYEGSENFYLDTTTLSSGYQPSATGEASIGDNELQPLEVSIFGKSITETDDNLSKLSLRVQLNQNAPVGGVAVAYTTADYTGGLATKALAGEDFTAMSSTLTIPEGSNVGYIEIPILGDLQPEELEKFLVKLTSTSKGTLTATEAIATIFDNDNVKVDVKCNDANEGNIGESNNIVCKIYLTKPLPLGVSDFTIDYQSEEGSSPSATSDTDYTAISGSVTFTTGDIEKIVNIPTIGDDDIEEDENVELVISGSSYIIDFESEAEIINDDGDYPALSFTSSNYSIVEGDSGQKMLDFTLTLSEPSVSGASFHYETWDDTAEDQANDNDYIYTYGDINLKAGEQNITISVPINGDTVIENNESFFLGFDKLSKLSWGAIEEVKGTIINDDGSFPQISIDDVNLTEGNSGTQIMNFTISTDKVPTMPLTFDYQILNGNNSNTLLNAQSPIDYINTNVITPVTLDSNITTHTISITINGDSDTEKDEQFYIQLTNPTKSTFAKELGIGTILNDDNSSLSFVCDETSYLFTSDQTAAYSDFYSIDLTSGEAIKQTRFGTSHINATGYNVQDNYIYGLEYGNDDVSDPNNSYRMVKIDANYNITRYDIAGLPKGRYYLGDVSMDGIYYLANRYSPDNSFDRLQEIQRIDIKTSTLLAKTTLNYPVGVAPIVSADFAFNPKDNQLYMVNANNNQLVRVNPSSGMVEELGDIGITDSTYSVISFFDVDGNFYFYADGNQKIYSIDISNPASIDATAIEFNDMTGLISSGDGARCANASVTPPNNGEAFVCNDSIYISSSIKRGTGETGKMWLHQIDTTQNPFGFNVLNDAGTTELYNALAYSEVDNYLYALYNRELIRLTKTGKLLRLGKVSALPSFLDTTQLYAGASYGGFYYVSGPGVNFEQIFKINLTDQTVTDINLSQALSIKDFSFSSDGTLLYGIEDGGSLVKIEVSTGTVTKIGTPHVGYEFDSTFSDATDRFFANDSNGNGFFEFDLTTGEKLFISDSQPATFNDGANCLAATLTFNDYGDAPSSYGKVWHKIANDIFLGKEVDHDVNTYNTLNADGDDSNGIDDEDGILLADGSDINGTYFELNTIHELNVTLSNEAYLNIWIDTDINGVFSDAPDLIYNSGVKLTAGSHVISFTLPSGLSTNTLTYLRARVSSIPNLNPTGFAPDGEVEDYAIKFGTDALRGTFNIERTDSETQTVNSDERNAWYTQIVGRDFHYSVVFYEEDMSSEKNVSNVTVKVDLVNMDTNSSLYNYKFHILDTVSTSRIDFKLPNDLDALPATKNARFRVTYGVNAAGDITQADCMSDPSLCPLIRADDARDNFAIRPDRFYIKLLDDALEKVTSEYPNPTSVRVAAGYDYNLSIIAAQHLSYDASAEYNETFSATFDFNMTGLTSCANTSSITESVVFQDGVYNNIAFNHDEVGHYDLLLAEDTNWTKVDQIKGDCIAKDATASTDGNTLSGCNIATKRRGISLAFYPYRFGVALSMQNLPSTTHPDFIYMSELNSTYNNVAIQFEGNITAQTEDNTTTKNFTAGCMAENLLLDLNASTVSVEGVNQIINTIEGTNVDFTRLIIFNNEPNPALFDLNRNLISIANSVPITSNRFLDENNGSMSLDMRYNLNKNLTQPINPVEVTFNSIDVSSNNAKSSAHQIDNHIPTGTRAFVDNVKNFYFAKVVSDLNNYPRVNMNISPLVRTPLNVDIYCRTNIANYCEDRNVIANSNLSGTTREQNGWYLSTNHNGDFDGKVTRLIDNPDNLTITPDNNISLPNGENGLGTTSFDNCNVPSVTVTIETDPVLAFEPSQYVVNCTENNASQWTGIGATGNVLEVTPKVNKSGKMDW